MISSCLISKSVLIPANGDDSETSGEMRKTEPSARFTRTAPSFFDLSRMEAKFVLLQNMLLQACYSS